MKGNGVDLDVLALGEENGNDKVSVTASSGNLTRSLPLPEI